jgi:hypothetical protein
MRQSTGTGLTKAPLSLLTLKPFGQELILSRVFTIQRPSRPLGSLKGVAGRVPASPLVTASKQLPGNIVRATRYFRLSERELGFVAATASITRLLRLCPGPRELRAEKLQDKTSTAAFHLPPSSAFLCLFPQQTAWSSYLTL